MFGPVNLGLLLAVVLTVLPVVGSGIHLFYAGRRLDPLARKVRAELETIRDS